MKKPWMDFRHATKSELETDIRLRSTKSFDTMNIPNSDLAIKTKTSLQSMKNIINFSRKLSVQSLRQGPSEDSSSPSLFAFPIVRPLHRNPSGTSTVDSGYFDSCSYDVTRPTSFYDSVPNEDVDTIPCNKPSAILDASYLADLNEHTLEVESDVQNMIMTSQPAKRDSYESKRARQELKGIASSKSKQLLRLLDPPPSVDHILLTMPYVQRYKAVHSSCRRYDEHSTNSPSDMDLAAQVQIALGSAVCEADEEWDADRYGSEYHIIPIVAV
jgi:hypothetical protein